MQEIANKEKLLNRSICSIDGKKIKIALQKSYDLEIKLKSYSSLNSKILLKKMLIDVCNLANAA